MPACPCGGGRSLSSWLLFRCPIRAQTPGSGFMEPRRLERSESPATLGVKPHRATGRHHAPARLPSLVMKGSPVRVRASALGPRSSVSRSRRRAAGVLDPARVAETGSA
jgi:hypothetical protein